MKLKFEIEGLYCICNPITNCTKIAYILYPIDILSDWIEKAAKAYGITIVVITGMEWEDAFSPWPAKGVPKGSPDFKGKSPEFLSTLQEKVIPQIETAIGITQHPVRTLIGVSMSGLFALWQWLICDTFTNIASLSGSFWYEGFVDWVKSRPTPVKSGKAFFLLGDQESKSKVKAFSTVANDTQEILKRLKDEGIYTIFESVPGNHYSDPIPRLDKAFQALYL